MNAFPGEQHSKDLGEKQSLMSLLQNGSWKELYQKSEHCFTLASNTDEESVCFLACLMLVSLLRLGKLEQARKWLSFWKEQFGWEDTPSDNLVHWSPLRIQYCILAVEVTFRNSSESDINSRLRPYFQLKKLIEENLQAMKSQSNLWLSFLNTLDSCIVSHLLEATRLEAAMDLAKNCLERNGDDTSFQLAWFRLLLFLGDTEQASLFWKTIESQVVDDSERHLHRGLLYAAQRKVEDAMDEWEAAALFEQTCEATVTNNIAVGYLLQGRVFEAVERIEEIFHKSPVHTLDEDLIKHICICYDMLLPYAQERKNSIQHAFTSQKGASSKIHQPVSSKEPNKR